MLVRLYYTNVVNVGVRYGFVSEDTHIHEVEGVIEVEIHESNLRDKLHSRASVSDIAKHFYQAHLVGETLPVDQDIKHLLLKELLGE